MNRMGNHEYRATFSVRFWNYKRNRLKMEYPTLTETDLTYIPGNLGELINGLGLKLGKPDDEIRNLITEL